ncbi:hypothetical protein [Clostridium saudiense]|uniref:hypothetical protein n=1 Tax=Clostridium saudiense TaxID=1414720 RepID=UPI000822CA4E|nr:hypothetical protein [Clostridium saudiense]MDU7453700.1 hypothetical protein [Clostridium saudiense]MEE0728455.1 hypothetical protein [Clostridium saudiense]SCJ87112.1 Uncharacterised protein [uncultured Clostridium sp.]
MNKKTTTYFFGIIGIITWSITIFLREQSINNSIINFILGIMPNISATWFFIWMDEFTLNIKKLNFTIKRAIFSSSIIFILALVSEIIHDIYLESPFDINDIIATILSIILYLIVFYFKKNTIIEDQF